MRTNRTPRQTAGTFDEAEVLRQLLAQVQAEKDALGVELNKTREMLAALAKHPQSDSAAPAPTRPGYLVITPSPYFDGEALGVRFDRGQAFIPDSDQAQAMAVKIANELGYSVLRLEDYTGPYERPEIDNKPPALPPEPSWYEELRELFGGLTP